jgi:hypothetical protein
MPATSRTTVAKANLCPLSASFCGHRSQHCRLASGCDPGKCCSSPHLLTFGHLQHGLLHSRNFRHYGATATNYPNHAANLMTYSEAAYVR